MTVLVVGSTTLEVQQLRLALDGTLEGLPPEPAVVGSPDPLEWPWADKLERWRDAAVSGPAQERIVVAVWPLAHAEPCALEATGIDEWVARIELPLARWYAAMGVAARRCADGGSIVAVVERAAPLDCADRAPETGAADAVESMVRSLARAEGARGVRVNAVTTPTRLAPAAPVAPAPSLPSFPGRLDVEVLGAVRMLLGPDAIGVTGTMVDADCGRSWR